MGKSRSDPQRASREKLDKLWRQIRDDADSRDCLTIRAAANIIGFCEFPVGWSWTEYKPYQHEKPRSYEDKARNVCTLGIGVGAGKRAPEGRVAEKTAKQFRMNRVEQLLKRLMRREEVRVTIYDDQGQGSAPSEKLRKNIATTIDVERSGYGPQELQFACSIDALDLVRLMGRRRWKDERKKKYDWLLIERQVRAYFETYGCPKRREDVYDHVTASLESDVTPDASSPSPAILKEYIATWRAEYAGRPNRRARSRIRLR